MYNIEPEKVSFKQAVASAKEKLHYGLKDSGWATGSGAKGLLDMMGRKEPSLEKTTEHKTTKFWH